MPPRLTQQSLRILKFFADRPNVELAGADVMKGTGFASGLVYPVLLRFEAHGLLESHWENEAPEHLGRPRRRFYRITMGGRQAAHEALRDLGVPVGLQAQLGGANS